MEIRLPSLMIMILFLLSLTFVLEAQEYREASHACFNLEEDRLIPLDRNVFTFRKEWSEKQVFVSIPPISIPCSFIVNGFRFGLEPGSTSISEYNITPFLNEQENILDLVPELQENDSLTFHAPMPACSLLIRDAIHARDLLITCHPGDSDNDILVRIDLLVKSYMLKENKARTIHMEVNGPKGQIILQETRQLNTHLSYGQETEMVFDLNLEDPSFWLPGMPDFYELVIALGEKGEQNPELISKQFEITSFWLNDSVLVQNGDTIVLQFPSDDLAVILPGLPEDEIKKVSQKQGVNAIRTETPLPCHLEAVFRRCGILVVSDKILEEQNM